MQHFKSKSFEILVAIVVSHFRASSLSAEVWRVSEALAPRSNVFESPQHILHNQNGNGGLTTDQDSRANLRLRVLPPPRSRRQRKAEVASGHVPGFRNQTWNESSAALLPRYVSSRRNHSRLHASEGIRSQGHGSTWLGDSFESLSAAEVSALEQFVVKHRLKPSRCDLIRRSSRHSVECNATGRDVPFPLLVTGVGRSGTSFLQKVLWTLGLNVRHDSVEDKTCQHANMSAQSCGAQGAVSWAHLFSDAGIRYTSNLKSSAVRQGEEQKSLRYCARPNWAWGTHGRRFKLVIHLVREPLKTIASRANMNSNSLNWLGGTIACATLIAPRKYFEHANKSRITWEDVKIAHLRRNNLEKIETVDLKILLSLRHFVTWNSFAERIASYTVAVEDIGPQFISWLCHHPVVSAQLWPNGCPSSVQVRDVIRGLGQKVNHDHVISHHGLEVESVTWPSLRHLDANSMTAAFNMAIRYGYQYNASNPQGAGPFIGRVSSSSIVDPSYDGDHDEAVGFTQFGQWFYRLKLTRGNANQ